MLEQQGIGNGILLWTKRNTSWGALDKQVDSLARALTPCHLSRLLVLGRQLGYVVSARPVFWAPACVGVAGENTRMRGSYPAL